MNEDSYHIIGIILVLIGTAIIFYPPVGYGFGSIGLIIGFCLLLIGYFFWIYVPGDMSTGDGADTGIIDTLDFFRTIIGVVILFPGSLLFFMGVIFIYLGRDFTILATGLGLIIISFLLFPIDHMKTFRENIIVVARFLIIIGLVMYGLFMILIGIPSMDILRLVMGFGSLIFSIVILPEKQREYLFQTFRFPAKIFRRNDGLEITKERGIIWKNPEGFEAANPRKYEQIPEEAIDPFTLYKIHDLIIQGKKIIRCRDCGVYYDEEVWRYYGKTCATMGCSNSEF
jgi:hypothetical protein